MSCNEIAGQVTLYCWPPWRRQCCSFQAAAHERHDVVYLQVLFCPVRCHFCYFKVDTAKDSAEIDRYLDPVVLELTLYSGRPFIGGTPSYLSTRQFSQIVDAMKRSLLCDEAEQVAFDCAPEVIAGHNLEIPKAMGGTTLSLGIENFDERISRGMGGSIPRSKSTRRASSRPPSGFRRRAIISIWRQ
jgi:coproporphyrinogen III oxidase-like Fe-S oxidoreductase